MVIKVLLFGQDEIENSRNIKRKALEKTSDDELKSVTIASNFEKTNMGATIEDSLKKQKVTFRILNQ